MAKTKEVAFKRGGDNKLRKTGNVGSHSTLVTEAKAPNTNINSVKIESKTKLVVEKPSTLKDYLKEAAKPSTLANLAEAKVSLEAIDVVIKASWAEVSGLILAEDFDQATVLSKDIHEANNIKHQIKLLIEERILADELAIAKAEMWVLAEANPDFMAVAKKLEKVGRVGRYVDEIKEERKRIIEADPKLKAVIKKCRDVAEKHYQALYDCLEEGFLTFQLLKKQ